MTKKFLWKQKSFLERVQIDKSRINFNIIISFRHLWSAKKNCNQPPGPVKMNDVQTCARVLLMKTHAQLNQYLECTFRKDFTLLWKAGTIPQLTDESHLCDLNDEAFRRLFCSLIKHDISLLVKLPSWHHKSRPSKNTAD